MSSSQGWMRALVYSFLLAPVLAAQGQANAGVPRPLGRLVDVGGYRVHLYCTGTGSPTTVIVGAGYSFDWDLVQSVASKDGRVCSYDASGTAWSDPSPEPSTCDAHIAELHRLLEAAGIKSRVVLVGQSIGGVFARLYAARYPRQVAGMVIVDHAAVIRTAGAVPTPGGGDSPYQALPARDRALHAWASALPSPKSPRSQRTMFDRCVAEADSIGERHPRGLGDIPLVVISLPIPDPGYQTLQHRLLGLSSNGAQLLASSSGHLIHIDRPDVVVHGIAMVRGAVRAHTHLP